MLRTAALLIALLSSSSAIAQDVEWTTSTSGGSTIEIPVFMTEGWIRALMQNGEDMGTAYEPELHPVQLRQFRTRATGRPYDHLHLLHGADATEITYSFDKDERGAISGYTQDRRRIFYGMCKKAAGEIVCFDMTWPVESQPMFGPILERIAASFRK